MALRGSRRRGECSYRERLWMRTMRLNIAQLLILVAAFLVAYALGAHFSKVIGWGAMIPSYFLGLCLFLLPCVELFESARKSLRIFREKFRTGTRK